MSGRFPQSRVDVWTVCQNVICEAIKQKFSDNVPAWHGMVKPLGEIQDACKELGLPNLPVMVVNQAKMRPAAGWYAQFGNRIIHSKDTGAYTPNEVRDMMGLPALPEFA